jgi:hypothetical protein
MSSTATPNRTICEQAPRHTKGKSQSVHPLGQYVERETTLTREIIRLPRPDGSAFIIDHLPGTVGDMRVIARIAPTEPPENASIITDMYLADSAKGHCRALSAEDLALTRPKPSPESRESTVLKHAPLIDREGFSYRIRELATGRSIPELRWARSQPNDEQTEPEAVKLRDVIARLEEYEPARVLTFEALAAYGQDAACSTCKLGDELERLTTSTVVLNRRLREAVQGAVKFRRMSMSEIALRCGRVRHNKNLSGDASWLARRIGQAPESGEEHPSPWVQSDVLALIAREGLGVCPCEVEL